MRKVTLMALATAALVGASAQAAQIFLSTSNAVGGAEPAQTNPALTIPVGGSATLYIWVKPDGTGASERLNGIGLSLASSAAGKLGNGVANVINPQTPDEDKRWDGTGNGVPMAPNGLVADMNAVAILAGYGISLQSTSAAAADPQRAGNAFLYGSVTFSGLAAGVSNLNLMVGNGTVSNRSTTGAITPIFFGAGEATSVPGNIPGGTGQIPDAVITVGDIPEPASLGLAAVAGLGLIRRRRA